jgi:hypothetical protein
VCGQLEVGSRPGTVQSLATHGIVSVTLNSRLDSRISHPELTKESPHHASRNYDLLDQHAPLLWVKRNIAAFDRDPNKITIGGDSAGSFAVSSLRDIVQQAGETEPGGQTARLAAQCLRGINVERFGRGCEIRNAETELSKSLLRHKLRDRNVMR